MARDHQVKNPDLFLVSDITEDRKIFEKFRFLDVISVLLSLAVSSVVLIADQSKHCRVVSHQSRDTLLVLLALGWLIKGHLTEHLAYRFQPMDHLAIFDHINAPLQKDEPKVSNFTFFTDQALGLQVLNENTVAQLADVFFCEFRENSELMQKVYQDRGFGNRPL